jgi:hypothetical protein
LLDLTGQLRDLDVVSGDVGGVVHDPFTAGGLQAAPFGVLGVQELGGVVACLLARRVRGGS